ncbi:hypothetical protein BLSTO_00405 [Blastocystis sp. subtype 1]
MAPRVVSPKEAKELADQVDRALPSSIQFYRYGDRTTQIIRFLIENDMDVAKTVVAIKQTALFRKYWHADEITIADVKNAFEEWQCYPTGVTKDGRMVWYVDCFMTKPPKMEDFMLVTIYMVDDIQKRLYEACQALGIPEAYKDYCIIVSDTARTSMSAFNTEMKKAGMDVFVRHFPAFMSSTDIEINENPAYAPSYDYDHSSFYNLNTPFLLRSIWKLCTLFMPARWAYMVQLLGSDTLPASIPSSCIPKKYGGSFEGSFEAWMQDCASVNGCSLDDPPRQLVDQRVLDQFGQNNGMIATEIPDQVISGWMWKRTNVGHRWHHYYFVLLKDGLLYYFKDVNDTDAQNGFMLENCRIVVCESHEDLKREGIASLTIASNVLHFTNPPLLAAGQSEATRGAEQKGEAHKYWFIVRTPSRDYVFACNSVEQRSQWMFFLNRVIGEANKKAELVL